MNDQDQLLRRRLAAIAEDAPSGASLVRTEHAGYHLRLRRRRWYAAGSVGLVVLVVTGTTTLLGPGLFAAPHEASPPVVTATLGPRASATTTPLAANSRLVPFAGVAVTSPVSVPASWVSYDQNPPEVDSNPTSLRVSWVEHAPVRTVATDPASAEVGLYRGYTITTTEPPLQVSSLSETVELHREDITINDHSARLVTVPAENLSTDSIPTDPQVIWQLTDGRWISVFSAGAANPQLVAFASAIQEGRTVFPPDISIGVTPKGYAAVSSTSSAFVSQMAGPRLTLCRPAPAPEDGNCLSVYANVADGGFGAGIVMGNESNAKFVADSVGVDVGGIQVRVNAEYQTSWTRWGKATIVVQSPGGVTLSTADLAALAASVRLAPTVGVKDEPNPLVESSLAQESAASPSESRPTR